MFKDKNMFENYCVIFDMDGVLADTGHIHYESWVKLAKQIGVKFSKKFFNLTFGQQSVTITRELVGPKIEQEVVEKWADLKERYYREMVKDELKPLPGALVLIKVLHARNFKLAVGSSGPPENVELLLSALSIKDYFNVIITAAEVKNGKPAPDVFLIAAEKLNIKVDNCLVIEDAPVGIAAARKAGMKVIALRTTHCNVELLDADMTVQDLSSINLKDILELLGIKKDT
jgi:beta-phosphoglucomutase family hydrolase